MEFATGALGTLLPKLGELLKEEYDLQKGLKKGIKDLSDELASIEIVLQKLSNVPLDQLDPLDKIWADDIRELSYAIEDNLDSFMVNVTGLEPTIKLNTFTDFIKKTGSTFTKFKRRHKIATDIKAIDRQLQKVNKRKESYKVNVVVDNLATTTVDPRLSALYSNVSDLIGIGGAIEEILKILSDGDDVTKETLKTVSVVGFGGLGKTTLVQAVYKKLEKNFDCSGVVPVGQKPDIEKVFEDILYELDKQKYMNISTSKLNMRQLIDKLRDFLTDKRYLIVIDDIWDIQIWETIKLALVEGNPETRIIITTRIREVAQRAGGVYDMKPLSKDNSRKLFIKRIFGDASICPDNQSAEVFDKFLWKCHGVPLSIITIASLLAGKRMDEWPGVYDSVGFGHEDNEAVQNTRKIISFSYYDLPYYLKNCLLYLSVYPEDVLIPKTQLVWKWVAEGLVSEKQGRGLFELGESYFNQLINKSLIQLRAPPSSSSQIYCSVHDMVVDLIRTISTELNFVTILGTEQQNPSSSNRRNITRRLSMVKRRVEHNPNTEMRQVRSFSAFMCYFVWMPPLVNFKALRVLVLDMCDFSSADYCLKNLGKLVQLRYLGLLNTHTAELPRDIVNLKLLQVLDITHKRRSGIKELPSSVCELQNLRYLAASKGTIMMGDVGKLQSLEELRLQSVDKSPGFVRGLGELTEMRSLSICFDEVDESLEKTLVESLHNLRRIKDLEIYLEPKEMETEAEWLCRHDLQEWAPPSELRALTLSWITTRRPSWIDPSCVPHLSYLLLAVKVLEQRDIQIIGKLTALRFLHAECEGGSHPNQSYTIASNEFQSLSHLELKMVIMCEDGALPKLRVLKCEARPGKLIGLVGNMPLLEDVTYELHCCASAEVVEDAEATLRQEAETHRNRPTLKIERIIYEMVSLDDESAMDKYLTDVHRLLVGPACGEDQLVVNTYRNDKAHVSGEVSDTDAEALVTFLEDKAHVSGEISATDAEPNEAFTTNEVRMAHIYLKQVLLLSEQVSTANEEVRTLATCLEHVLHVPKKLKFSMKEIREAAYLFFLLRREVLAYLRAVLNLYTIENITSEQVLALATHLKHVIQEPEEVYASDALVRRYAEGLEDVQHEHNEACRIRMAVTYFKKVLFVSDEVSYADKEERVPGDVSATDEERSKVVAYLMVVLLPGNKECPHEVLLNGARLLKQVIQAPEKVWSADRMLHGFAVALKRKRLLYRREVSANDEEPSDKGGRSGVVPAAVAVMMKALQDLDRLTYGNTEEGGEKRRIGASAADPGPSHS